jgi:hypothetical protein|tara:strand:- start:513 stop:899 length:387 start_codon:yes stop_codon:yes gene_type:complete
MKKWLYLIFLTSSLFSQIEIEPVGLYNLKKVGRKTYVLKLNNSSQTLVRLTGRVQDGGYQKVMWKTDKKYWWSNGFAKDEFKVVNPATYSNNGVVNTMFGPLPEMKGKTVAITASYGRHKDKIYIKLR